MALVAPAAAADDHVPLRGEADVRADDVELDAKTRELLLRGNVRVDAPPFHLKSDALHVRRTPRGALDVEGDGRLAFCPCLGTPLAVRFQGATVAPPGDLILRSPTLEIVGAPVLWLPYFWLRSPAKAGLLPPDVAYRGADGMFLGGGIHLPWGAGDAKSGLDVRAGGYFKGGVAVDAVLATPSSATRVAWDHLHGDGLTIDARGAVETRSETFAWDTDAIRGARGVLATTDLDAAARPYDRASGEASLRSGGWTFATALRTVSPRGGSALDIGMAGPIATLRRAEGIAGAGAYDATVEGGMLSQPGRNVSFGRGEAGALLADRWGALGATLALRAAGDVVGDGQDRGASRSGADGAASARARLALPFGRGFASGEPNDPWIHRLEPSIGVGALASRGDELLGVAPGRGVGVVHGDAWVADAALASEQGRWGARIGSEVAVSAGAVGSLDELAAPRAVTRARVALSAPALGLTGEAARVFTGPAPGGAFLARVRVGEVGGLHVVALAAERDGVDPVLARALTDAPLEPSGGILSSTGWTLGGRARIPWTAWLATTGGADVDVSAQLLVAARGGFELRDKCGCVALRATAAHRLGREGVDAWVTIDLAPR